MDKSDKFQNESISKGNSENSLLVIYVLRILKKYSSPENPITVQDVIDYLKKDYSIGSEDKSDSQQKKVRRHLDTLCESYWNHCIKKVEGKTKTGHKWFYDVSADEFAKEDGVSNPETLSAEEIDFIIDIIASSKIINEKSTHAIIKKLLEKTDLASEDRKARLNRIENEKWPKSINKDLVLIQQTIESCRRDCIKIRFDYEDKCSISATPYGWDSDEDGKYILIAKVDGAGDGKFESFLLEKIQNIEKADMDYSECDDSYFELPCHRPDELSMESLFSNIRIITDAIEKKSGIEFKYLTYVIRDNRVVVEGKDKCVLPHRLVFSDGKYYLIGYDNEQAKIDYYRVDLISKLDYSDAKIKISDWNKQMLSGLNRAREVEKHPLMQAGTEFLLTFKVAESALDRVIDAFAAKPDEFEVTEENRVMEDDSEDGFHEERLVKFRVRTTAEEAFRWALANADAVEITTQEIRDRIARISEPVYQLYTQTVSDKVRENIDNVLKKKTFEIYDTIDENIAYETYKELSRRGKLGVVRHIVIEEEIYGNIDYLGEFTNTETLTISSYLETMDWASKLVNVKTLLMYDSSIEDYSWMKEMKKLRRIHMPESLLSDLSVISDHTDIEYLDISGTKVRDIGCIENFRNLTQLFIAVCPIDDYSPLFKTQKNLEMLQIDNNALEKIGEENIRNRHFGVRLDVTKNTPFWFL